MQPHAGLQDHATPRATSRGLGAPSGSCCRTRPPCHPAGAATPQTQALNQRASSEGTPCLTTQCLIQHALAFSGCRRKQPLPSRHGKQHASRRGSPLPQRLGAAPASCAAQRARARQQRSHGCAPPGASRAWEQPRMRSQPAWPGGQATNAAAHAPRWAATDGAGTPEHAPRSCTDARTLAPLHHGGLAPATIRKRTVRGVRLHAGTPPRAARAIGCRRRLLPAARMTAAERRPKACATGRGSQPPQCGARGRRGHACGTAVPPAPAASRRARTPVPEGQMRTSLPGAAASAASVPSMRHSGDSATAASSWGCRADRPRQRRLAALCVHEDACPGVLADALEGTQGRKWGQQPDWCGFARPVLAVPSGGLTTTVACNRGSLLCLLCAAA